MRTQSTSVLKVTGLSSSHAVQIKKHKQRFLALLYTLGVHCSTQNHTTRQHKDISKQITKTSSLFPQQQERSKQIHLLSPRDIHSPKTTIKPGRESDSTKGESRQQQRPATYKDETGTASPKRNGGLKKSWEGVGSNCNKQG